MPSVKGEGPSLKWYAAKTKGLWRLRQAVFKWTFAVVHDVLRREGIRHTTRYTDFHRTHRRTLTLLYRTELYRVKRILSSFQPLSSVEAKKASLIRSVQFSSVQDGIWALGKAHNYVLHPVSLRSFPIVLRFHGLFRLPVHGHVNDCFSMACTPLSWAVSSTCSWAC